MGRTACTEPQCLYKGALCHLTFLYFLFRSIKNPKSTVGFAIQHFAHKLTNCNRFVGVDWGHLPQTRNHRWAVVNTVTNVCVTLSAGGFLSV
jgi:hypothetical protein